MKKEVWALFVILGVIFGVIFMFAKWNQNYGPAKKRRVRRGQQRNTCVTFVHIAKKRGVPFSEKQCERDLVGLGKKRWRNVEVCMRKYSKRTRELDLLACVGGELCDLDRGSGCILKGGALMLMSNKEKQERGSSLLAKMCEKKDVVACDVALELSLSHSSDRGAGKQRQRLLSLACSAGRKNACRTIQKDPLLESCALENIPACGKRAASSQDPLVHFLACSYGYGASCSRVEELLFPGGDILTRNGRLFAQVEACLAGDLRACGKTAAMRHNEGLGQYACREGDAQTCRWLAARVKEPRRRLYLLHQLCTSGDEKACAETYALAPLFLR